MIRPNDCLRVGEKEALKELEEKIDDYLRDNYTGEKPLHLCHIINISEGKIRNTIIKRYKQNGWDVWFKPSGVDGLPEGPYFMEQGKRPEREGE